jgi:LDH2 family malate/lactate/ureidoglycolate dehydrogenase
MPVVAHERLTDFCRRMLVGAGVREDHAELTATMLVAANLRGIDSHGVQLLGFYVDQLLGGDMEARAEGGVISENGATMIYDCGGGLGQVTSAIATDHAVRLARAHGLGAVTTREGNHFGGAFWWARRMAREGMIGMVMCNASPLVPPWQGREPKFGTNPICMALPGEESWLLDMATTTVAAGKIFKASINGEESIPAGWAMDRMGVPTTDTRTAMSGLLMPLGGYKGYGLAMMVELLTGVLSGGAFSTQVASMRFRGKRPRLSHFFLAIDIGRFMPVEEFSRRADELMREMRDTPPAQGYDEVMIAGEPERRMEAERRESGIPVAEGNWETLCAAGGRVGVAF